MEQRGTKKQIFLIFYIGLFILVGWLFRPYLTPLLWAFLLYSFTRPLFERCAGTTLKHRAALNMDSKTGAVRDKLYAHGLKKNLLAAVFAILDVLLIAVPLGFLAFALVRQLLDVFGTLLREVESRPELFSLKPDSPLGSFIYRLSNGAVDLSKIDIVAAIRQFISARSSRIISYSGSALKNITNFVINLAFMVFTLFFLYLDGRELINLLIGAIPLERNLTTMFFGKIRRSSHELVTGYLLVALYQGLAMALISRIFGLGNNLVIGVLTAVASFIPMIGTGFVWLPLSIYMALSRGPAMGIVFLIVSSVPVALLDNFIRSKVIGDRLSVHPLLIFFSIIGGIKLFGFDGLLLGPIILIVFLSAISIYDAIDESV